MRTKLAILVLLAPVLATASGFEVINVNPRDLSLCSSAVAAQNTASATNVNPAALSKLSGLNLSLAGSVLSIASRWRAPAGDPYLTGTATTTFTPVTPVALFAAYGTKLLDRGLGVGFGVGTPGGGQVKWQDEWQGRARIIEVERRMLGFYLNAGYEVMPWLRVGGGVIYYEGIQYLKQGINPFPDAFAELSTDGGGFAYEVSTEIQPLENLTLGFDYKHKGTMHMTGDAHFQVPDAIRGPSTTDQGAKEDLTFPNLIATGVAYRVAKPWLVTLQYSWSRFVVYNQDLFQGDQGVSIVVPRNYRNGNIIRGGVEWSTTDRLTLRVGVMRDWSGYRSTTLSPTLPDSNITAGATGASWKLRPDLGIHGAFFYGKRDPTVATGPVAFPGTYSTNVWIASLGVTWQTDLGR